MYSGLDPSHAPSTPRVSGGPLVKPYVGVLCLLLVLLFLMWCKSRAKQRVKNARIVEVTLSKYLLCKAGAYSITG